MSVLIGLKSGGLGAETAAHETGVSLFSEGVRLGGCDRRRGSRARSAIVIVEGPAWIGLNDANL